MIEIDSEGRRKADAAGFLNFLLRTWDKLRDDPQYQPEVRELYEKIHDFARTAGGHGRPDLGLVAILAVLNLHDPDSGQVIVNLLQNLPGTERIAQLYFDELDAIETLAPVVPVTDLESFKDAN